MPYWLPSPFSNVHDAGSMLVPANSSDHRIRKPGSARTPLSLGAMTVRGVFPFSQFNCLGEHKLQSTSQSTFTRPLYKGMKVLWRGVALLQVLIEANDVDVRWKLLRLRVGWSAAGQDHT